MVVSTADVVTRFTVDETIVRVPLETLVQVAVARNLSFLASEAALANARYGAKANVAAFDPVFSADYSQSHIGQHVVYTPGVIPAESYSNSQTTTFKIDKNTTIGTLLSISAQNQRTQENSIAPTQPLFNSSVILDVTQPLLRGFGRSAAFAAAKIAQEGGDAALAASKRILQQTVAAVESGYWTLRQDESNEAVTLKSLRIAEKIMRQNQELNKLNLLSAHDALTSEEQVEILRTSYLEAVRTREDDADNLIFLCYGAQVQELLDNERYTIGTATGAPAAAPTLPPLSQAVAMALKLRPDVAQARSVLAEQNAFLAQARNALLPQLDFTGTLASGGSNQSGDPGALNDAITGALHGRDHAWSVGGAFSIPIGDRIYIDKYRAAKAAREQAELALQGTENTVRFDVRSAVRGVETESLRYQVAQAAARLSWLQFEQEQARLRLGLSDSFRVLQSQDLALQAQQSLNGVALALAQAEINYRLAVGTIAQKYMADLKDVK